MCSAPATPPLARGRGTVQIRRHNGMRASFAFEPTNIFFFPIKQTGSQIAMSILEVVLPRSECGKVPRRSQGVWVASHFDTPERLVVSRKGMARLLEHVNKSRSGPSVVHRSHAYLVAQGRARHTKHLVWRHIPQATRLAEMVAEHGFMVAEV